MNDKKDERIKELEDFVRLLIKRCPLPSPFYEAARALNVVIYPDKITNKTEDGI